MKQEEVNSDPVSRFKRRPVPLGEPKAKKAFHKNTTGKVGRKKTPCIPGEGPGRVRKSFP